MVGPNLENRSNMAPTIRDQAETTTATKPTGKTELNLPTRQGDGRRRQRRCTQVPRKRANDKEG